MYPLTFKIILNILSCFSSHLQFSDIFYCPFPKAFIRAFELLYYLSGVVFFFFFCNILSLHILPLVFDRTVFSLQSSVFLSVFTYCFQSLFLSISCLSSNFSKITSTHLSSYSRFFFLQWWTFPFTNDFYSRMPSAASGVSCIVEQNPPP